MNRMLRGKKLLYFFLLSYFLIFLMPIFVGINMYTIQRQSLVNEKMHSSEEQLQQAGRQLENALQDILQAGNLLTGNRNLRKYLLLRPPLQLEERTISVDVIQSLNEASQICEISDAFYLYAHNTDTIITQTASYSPELFYKYNGQFSSLSYDDWISSLKDESYRYFHVTPATRLQSGEEVPVLIIEQSLPKDHLYSSQAVLHSIVRQDTLLSYLQDNTTDAFYLLLDANGQVLAKDRPFHPEIISGIQDASDSSMIIDVAGENYLVTTMSTKLLSWRLVMATSFSTLYQEINAHQRSFMISYSICLPLGIMLIVFFARLQYSPLKMILDNLDHIGGVHPPNKSAYTYIHTSLQALLRRNSELESRLTEIKSEKDRYDMLLSDKGIQNNLLAGLIQGPLIDTVNALPLLKMYGVTFDKPMFAVVMFVSLAPLNVEAECNTFANQVHTLLQNAPHKERILSYQVHLGRKAIAAILNADATLDAEDFENWVAHINRSAVNTVSSVICCPGSLQNNIIDLPASFQAACEQADQALAKTNRLSSNLLFGYRSTSSNTYYDLVRDILNAFRNGDVMRSDELLINLYNRCSSESDFIIRFCHHLLTLLDEMQIPYDTAVVEEMLLVPQSQGDRFSAVCHVSQMLGKVVLPYDHDPSTGVRPVAWKIRQYIEEHLTDQNLNQSALAERFGMSQSSISKIFKKEWDINMLDFINQARVTECMKLLRETTLSLPEIAEKIGFTNSNTLIRLFKKYQSITPSQYRQLERMDK